MHNVALLGLLWLGAVSAVPLSAPADARTREEFDNISLKPATFASLTPSKNTMALQRRPGTTYRRPQYPTDWLQWDCDRHGCTVTVPMTINHNQTLDVMVDTGSSDTWVVQKDFQCHDKHGSLEEEASCGFESFYNGTLQSIIVDQILEIGYADNTYAQGVLGFADIDLGSGLTVQQQEIGLVNDTYWFGDNRTSGLLGLGYAAGTRAYSRNQGSGAMEKSAPYSPIFESMYNQGLVAPIFSIALSRPSLYSGYGSTFAGLLSFGDVEYKGPGIGDFVNTSIQYATAFSDTAYTAYAIVPDGILFGASSYEPFPQNNNVSSYHTTNYQFLVDTGSAAIVLPGNTAASVNALFDPPAQEVDGGFLVQCNATAPVFGVSISGCALYVEKPEDLIIKSMIDPTTEMCYSAIQKMDSDFGVLGVPWLTSVVAIFDVGASEMRFAWHEY